MSLEAAQAKEDTLVRHAQPGTVPARPILDSISVVIPTVGRPILERSLAAVAAGTVWPHRLIVVDQGNNPEVSAWLATLTAAGLNTLHLTCATKGRAVGVNRGIREVDTRFVCITDDDCLVEPQWLERLHSYLSAAPHHVFTGRVDGDGPGVAVVSTSLTPAVQQKPRLQFDSLSGGNMGLAVAITDRIGLLDEDPCLRTAEDGEYAYRALRAGIPIAYVPDAAVCHLGWRSPTEREMQYASYARSQGGFYGKYLRRGDWFIALRATLHHLRALKRWVRGAVRRDPDTAANGRAYFTGLIPGMVEGWRSTAGTVSHPRT